LLLLWLDRLFAAAAAAVAQSCDVAVDAMSIAASLLLMGSSSNLDEALSRPPTALNAFPLLILSIS
jgi:hypothetical protein